MSKTVYLKFTKNTANYVAGDVVAFDEDGKEMIDALIKKHFVKERTRYTVVNAPAKKVKAVADANVQGADDTQVNLDGDDQEDLDVQPESLRTRRENKENK